MTSRRFLSPAPVLVLVIVYSLQMNPELDDLQMAVSSLLDMPGFDFEVLGRLDSVVHKDDANDDANDDVVVQAPKPIAAYLDVGRAAGRC